MLEEKRKLEEELREYPYKLMSLEISGLGTVCNLEKIADKYRHPSDSVARAIEYREVNEKRLKAIEWVLDRLPEDEKKIIRTYYFEGNITKPAEVMNILSISERTYQRAKNRALEKFAITLGYI